MLRSFISTTRRLDRKRGRENRLAAFGMTVREEGEKQIPRCARDDMGRGGESEERFLTSADRPIRRSESEGESRPAAFGMTDGEWAEEKRV